MPRAPHRPATPAVRGVAALRGSAALRGLGRRADAWAGVGASVAALALVVVSSVLGATLYQGLLLFVFPLAILHCGSIVLALVRPRVAGALSLVGAVGIILVANQGSAPWPWSVTALITQALVTGIVGYRARWPEGVVLLAIGAVASGVLAMVVPQRRTGEEVAVDLVVFTSVAGVALVAGVVLQRWGAIRSQLARERRVSEEERARRLLAEEKTRVARELHDVIAHSMSLISVQAASAPFRLPGVGDEVRHEFEDMAASSRRALAEMRSLLSVLREEDSPSELAPQPGLDAIPDLVERVARSGADIELVWPDDGIASDDAGVAGVAAYRIVQEAVSNAIRHTDHPRIIVRVDRDAEGLELEIANDAGVRARSTDPVGGGSGLIGMRERAVSVGGELAHHALAGGGFVVLARLPLALGDTRP